MLIFTFVLKRKSAYCKHNLRHVETLKITGCQRRDGFILLESNILYSDFCVPFSVDCYNVFQNTFCQKNWCMYLCTRVNLTSLCLFNFSFPSTHYLLFFPLTFLCIDIQISLQIHRQRHGQISRLINQLSKVLILYVKMESENRISYQRFIFGCCKPQNVVFVVKIEMANIDSFVSF